MHLVFVKNLIVSLRLNEDSCIDAWRAVDLEVRGVLLDDSENDKR